MKSTIDIKNKSKARVLAALYNNSRPQGLGLLQYKAGNLPIETAESLLKQTQYFDYLQGRVMKVDLSGDELDPYLYDRDNGTGAAQRALEGVH